MVDMHKNKKGFTLTEVMLVVVIFGTIALVVGTIFIQVTRNFKSNKARITIQREARNALDLINRNLRQASASTIVISNLSSQPPYSKISFTSTDGNNWSFYQENQTLNVLLNTSTSTICENLRYIAFTYPDTSDSHIVSVSITTEQETYETQMKTLQLSVEKVRIMND